MIVHLIKRIANYVILTAVATSLAYVLASKTLKPQLKFESRHPRPPQASIDNYLDRLGVNPKVPVVERTWHWFTGVLHGDLGLGMNNQPVAHEMWVRMGVSLQMLLVGSIIGILLGIALGVWGAVKQYSFSDNFVSVSSFVIFAMPVFVMGVLAMIIMTTINHAVGHNLVNFSGQYTVDVKPGWWPHLLDRIQHLALPTIVLALSSAATYSRYQRSTMLDVLGADYIRTARAKGRRRTSALVRHGVRVALIPMSVFLAYSFGLLVTGATFLEIVFGWHGMGEFALHAVLNNDINQMAGSTLYVAVLILFSSTLSEVLYAALDPRVRR
ncbi:ABC transporter permease [Nocardioides montaniterrae]